MIQRQYSRTFPDGLLFLLCLLAAAPAAALGLEVEPNDSCPGAQPVGSIALPFTLDGVLSSTPGDPDVDFFRVSLTPGSVVQVDLEGQSTGQGSLSDPYVGLFDSSCVLITVNDDGGIGVNSRITTWVPADGVLVLAATNCCDGGFVGGGEGTYRIAVTEAAAGRSISGRLVDDRDGRPLPGSSHPYANVVLTRCDEFGNCFIWVNSQSADDEGRFFFDRDAWNQPLAAGTYQIQAWANSYEPFYSEPFFLEDGQALDLGDLALVRLRLIASVTGRLVDAVTGEPLTSDHPTYAVALLERCDGGICTGWTVAAAWPDPQGFFRIDGAAWLLAPGSYRVLTQAQQYRQARTAIFEAAEGQDVDVGTLRVEPLAIRISNVRPCESLPAVGGPCRYSFTVENRLPRRFSGEVWSRVDGNQIGGALDFTSFQVGRHGSGNPMPQKLRLQRLGREVVSFEFDVPAEVKEGAYFCVTALVGEDPFPQFRTLGDPSCLFWITKTGEALRVAKKAPPAASGARSGPGLLRTTRGPRR